MTRPNAVAGHAPAAFGTHSRRLVWSTAPSTPMPAVGAPVPVRNVAGPVDRRPGRSRWPGGAGRTAAAEHRHPAGGGEHLRGPSGRLGRRLADVDGLAF